MRAGPMLNLLRPAAPAEALLHAGLPDGVVALDDDGAGEMEDPQEDQRLFRAFGLLNTLLGKTVLRASLSHIWRGCAYFDEVVPVLVNVLTGLAHSQGECRRSCSNAGKLC